MKVNFPTETKYVATIIVIKRIQNFPESFSRKKIRARIAVIAVVIICESVANVPVLCVRPKNRNITKRPDAKIPTIKISFHDESDVFFKSSTKAPLR